MNINFRNEIIDLISLKAEGSYWDFKKNGIIINLI